MTELAKPALKSGTHQIPTKAANPYYNSSLQNSLMQRVQNELLKASVAPIFLQNDQR